MQRCVLCNDWTELNGRCWRCWPIVKPSEPALTPDTVRRIVREEIDKALAAKEAETWQPPKGYRTGPW